MSQSMKTGIELTLLAALALGVAVAWDAASADLDKSRNGSKPDNKTPPVPTPDPSVRVLTRLLIVTQPGCAHCDRLKKDWPEGFGYPTEWKQNSQEIADEWNVTGVPVIIALDQKGVELKRLLGWYPKEKIKQWLADTVSSRQRNCCIVAGDVSDDRASLADLERFPALPVVLDMAVSTRRTWELASDLKYLFPASKLLARWEREADHARECWTMLVDAGEYNARHAQWSAALELQALRQAMGSANYWQGRMPRPPILPKILSDFIHGNSDKVCCPCGCGCKGGCGCGCN